MITFIIALNFSFFLDLKKKNRNYFKYWNWWSGGVFGSSDWSGRSISLESWDDTLWDGGLNAVCLQHDESRGGRAACDAWVGVDEAEHWSPLHLLLLLLPFLYQVAYPWKTILLCTTAALAENGSSLQMLSIQLLHHGWCEKARAEWDQSKRAAAGTLTSYSIGTTFCCCLNCCCAFVRTAPA